MFRSTLTKSASLRGLAIATTATAIVGTAAFAQEPVQGGTLNAIINPEPPILMLGLNQQGPTQAVAGKIYQSLLTYTKDLEPQPSLATEWEMADDGLSYTFRLAENVTWHDGEPFTAEDVVFSYDEFLPETHPRWRNVHARLSSIEAVDDHTVEFTMEEAFPAFLLSFSVDNAPIIPRHIYEDGDYQDNPANQTPIGTGPFKFEEWQRGSYIHLVRNEDYWKEGKPHLDEIYYHVIPDAASRAAAMETGQVQMSRAEDIEFFDVPRLAGMDNLEMTTDGWEMYGPLGWLEFNVREEPISDVRFRKAVMHALDRDFIVQNIFFGLGEPATGPFNSATLFQDPDAVVTYDYDLDQANALLDEMGLERGDNGMRVSLRLLPMPYGETWDRLAEYTRQQLAEIGVDAQIEAADAGTWAERVAAWDFDMTFSYLYQFGDPAIGVSRSYVSSNIRQTLFTNTMGYENERVDELFEAAAGEVDPDQRQEYYSEVQEILTDELPVAWLIELGFPTIYDARIHNAVTTAIGTNETYDDVWIEE